MVADSFEDSIARSDFNLAPVDPYDGSIALRAYSVHWFFSLSWWATAESLLLDVYLTM